MIEYLKEHSDVVVACISAVAAIIVAIIGIIHVKNKRNGNKTFSQSVKNTKNSTVNQYGGNVNIKGNYSSNNNNSHKNSK